MSDRHAGARFLVVGILAVVIDFVSYRLLLLTGLGTAPAKAIGFIAGAVFAYAANRRWTFRAEGGTAVMLRFTLTYAVTLGCNVATNALVLALLPLGEAARITGFLMATAVSAALNFLGMKVFVFTSPRHGKAA